MYCYKIYLRYINHLHILHYFCIYNSNKKNTFLTKFKKTLLWANKLHSNVNTQTSFDSFIYKEAYFSYLYKRFKILIFTTSILYISKKANIYKDLIILCFFSKHQLKFYYKVQTAMKNYSYLFTYLNIFIYKYLPNIILLFKTSIDNLLQAANSDGILLTLFPSNKALNWIRL